MDILIHGSIDFIKSRVTKYFDWQINQHSFWISLGADQEAHNYTHLLYVLIILL